MQGRHLSMLGKLLSVQAESNESLTDINWAINVTSEALRSYTLDQSGQV